MVLFKKAHPLLLSKKKFFFKKKTMSLRDRFGMNQHPNGLSKHNMDRRPMVSSQIGFDRRNQNQGFRPFQVRHPSKVGVLSSIGGAFFGSLIFTVLLGIGTGFLVKNCTIEEDGTASMYCSANPGGDFDGHYPDYATNLGLIAVVMFVARFVSQSVTGQWSQGDTDLPFTLLRMLKTWIVGDEDRQIANRAAAILSQAGGTVCGVLLVWLALGDNDAYEKEGPGLGGPGVSAKGVDRLTSVWVLLILVSFVRGLVFLWTYIERIWTSNVDMLKKDQYAVNLDGERAKMSSDIAVNDYYLFGMTQHVRALTLALVDAGLVAVTGIIIGTSGFWWRDFFSLMISDTKGLCDGDAEGCNSDSNSGYYWAVFLLVPLLGYTLALSVCLTMLAVIRFSVKEEKPM